MWTPATDTAKNAKVHFGIGFATEKEQMEWYQALTDHQPKQASRESPNKQQNIRFDSEGRDDLAEENFEIGAESNIKAEKIRQMIVRHKYEHDNSSALLQLRKEIVAALNESLTFPNDHFENQVDTSLNKLHQ